MGSTEEMCLRESTLSGAKCALTSASQRRVVWLVYIIVCTPPWYINSKADVEKHWRFWSQTNKRINAFRTWNCHWSAILWKESVPQLHSCSVLPFSASHHIFVWFALICSAGLGLERFTDPTVQDKTSIWRREGIILKVILQSSFGHS